MISHPLELDPSGTPRHAGALVCVVDDDEAVRRCLDRLFRSARFPVKTFASARDYLECGEHPGPVCVVLDIRMPDIDGFDLQKSLAGRCDQVVFLTGHGDVPMCAKAMKAGAVDFLTKPVDDDVLLSAVIRALDRAREIGAIHAEQAAAGALLECAHGARIRSDALRRGGNAQQADRLRYSGLRKRR